MRSHARDGIPGYTTPGTPHPSLPLPHAATAAGGTRGPGPRLKDVVAELYISGTARYVLDLKVQYVTSRSTNVQLCNPVLKARSVASRAARRRGRVR